MKRSFWRRGLGAIVLMIATAFATWRAVAVPAQILATFKWDASPGQSVVGYALYYGVANLPITNRVDAGTSTTATIPLYVNTNYSLVVVSYSAAGVESLPSNVVNFAPPPISRLRLNKQAGGGMFIQFLTSPLAPCRIECTSGLNPPQWELFENVAADDNGNVVVIDPPTGRPATRYYRAVKL